MLPWVEANNDKCFFCKGPDPGYSTDDDQGIERPACWKCVCIQRRHAKEVAESQTKVSK